VPNHRPTSTSAFSCGSHSRWGARADDSAGLGGQRGRAHLDHSPALSRGETSSREHAGLGAGANGRRGLGWPVGSVLEGSERASAAGAAGRSSAERHAPARLLWRPARRPLHSRRAGDGREIGSPAAARAARSSSAFSVRR
jgi:hypothetical protein